MESKKISPLPTVKTDTGITKLEIKPANAQRHFANSSITFTTTPTVQKQGQTYKVVSGNQFIQLKPSIGNPEQKYMTVKSQMPTKLPSSIVGTSKIYTLKTGSSGTHLIPMENTSSGSSSGNRSVQSIQQQSSSLANFSPTKFTIMKNTGKTNANASPDSSTTTVSAEEDYSNILDMPVVFADNEGNIQNETPPTPKTYKTVTTTQPTTQRPQYIIQKQAPPHQQQQTSSQISQIQPGKQIVISSVGVGGQKPKPGNVVLLNKSTMKPITSFVTKAGTTQSGMTTIKYAKLVTTSDGQKIVIPASAPSNTIDHRAGPSTTVMSSGKKIEILNSSILKAGETKFTPIIINVDNKNPQMKTIVRKPDMLTTSMGSVGQQIQVTKSTVQPGTAGTIVIRPNILKQVPTMTKTKPGILNRGNLTVKRVINVTPTMNQIPKPKPDGTS